MTIPGRLLCMALALTVAGCGALRGLESGEPPAVVEEARPDDLDRLLTYFARARKLPAGEQGKEHESARQAYLRSQSDYNRVRLAMLLSLPGTVFNDEARALELIDPLARNQRASLSTLAVLLGSYIQEQKRLSGNVQALQQNVQGLQHKLDALKSLDRSLIEREQGGAKKR
ncbi:MAG: hypothetical protein AABZ67_16765 [Pseudomonadota bacterium]|mgnify:CR=1 FL=1